MVVKLSLSPTRAEDFTRELKYLTEKYGVYLLGYDTYYDSPGIGLLDLKTDRQLGDIEFYKDIGEYQLEE